jgi:hypothetical protein
LPGSCDSPAVSDSFLDYIIVLSLVLYNYLESNLEKKNDYVTQEKPIPELTGRVHVWISMLFESNLQFWIAVDQVLYELQPDPERLADRK